MTVSACGKFRPTPPALRLIKNKGTSPLVNLSISASRFLLCPVSLTQGMPNRGNSCSIRPSISVNCENSKILRPSATISGSMSSNWANLADCVTWLAELSFSKRGSQQTCRNFSRASKIVICDRAKPCACRASRTVFSMPKRMVSYKSACWPSNGTGIRVSILGGNSLATRSFVRRNMKGVTLALNKAIFSALPCRSMGVRNSSVNRRWLPKKPGIKK